jgi:uncharacterized phage protein gp47/JayE
MATTQQTLALQMIAQLRLLDPSISAEVGTPERKIVDTVAQSLYENQIDLDALSAGLDIDSKYGDQLDRFLSIFGFARQKATFATGFVTFSRVTPANVDVRVAANTQVAAPILADAAEGDQGNVFFFTLFDATIPAGSTAVIVPVRAVTAGVLGNVAANRITIPGGVNTIFGVTGITNETPTSGGTDSETDEEYKVRFKNTVFRNLAGTQDQYMALSIATAYSTRANVVGPQSHYREYVQVPPTDDTGSYDIDGDGDLDLGSGTSGNYTTALSTIPYAKHIYASEYPVFVSNGDVGLNQVFYRQDFDFAFNSPPKNWGDSFRLANVSLDSTVASSPLRPNVSFNNIYTGTNTTVTAILPGAVVLLEYSYMSEASRNDITNNILNAVDVYIDGGNDLAASTVIVRPKTTTAFVDDGNSKYHYENYRRTGEPEKRPIIGNVLTPMFWQPATALPDEIVVGTTTYVKGVHYWLVEDISALAGTIRARNGIEWSTKVFGKAQTDIDDDPATYTGKIITDTTGDPVGGQAIEIGNYTYDRNLVDLQAALEGSKQVTTDVLAHKSKLRYFKFDVTVMYAQGASISDTNSRIRDSVDLFLQAQYFGSAIQLSDLLQVIHSVSGVDNVRWTSDTPNSPDLIRAYETDANGLPLLNVTADRIQPGNGSRVEIQGVYLTGAPTSGFWTVNGSTAMAYNVSTATAISTIQAAVASTTVTEDARTNVGARYPIRSFRIQWSGNGAHDLVPVSASPTAGVLSGGPYVLRTDFFLRDDELARLAVNAQPTDTVAGMIIRPRAQNTWVKTY